MTNPVFGVGNIGDFKSKRMNITAHIFVDLESGYLSVKHTDGSILISDLKWNPDENKFDKERNPSDKQLEEATLFLTEMISMRTNPEDSNEKWKETITENAQELISKINKE